ncbi:MAG: DNA internalization-related competence protein ComEC/Rec2 [Gammaproteobacteria bacterium]
MFSIAGLFLAGILVLNLCSDLPGTITYVALSSAAASWWFKRHSRYAVVYRALTVFMFGMVWAQLHATDYLTHVLPETLAGKDILITGRIDDIPVSDATVQRFIVDVDKLESDHDALPSPQRIKLSWYYGEPVRAGETWRFKVRLKPPHGFMNPGGFDYEAWLMQNGIHASGYVRKDDVNRKLAAPALTDSAAIRQRLAERIRGMLTDSAFTGLITALAVGDRSAIEPHQWQVLIKTGTNHLMAISGLHIGLAAAFGYGLCRWLVPVRIMQRIPAQYAAMLCALVFALIYAMLAGFAIPTQRALLMLTCTVGAALLRRKSRPLDVLAFALVVVLLWDPASVLSAGFWFSFLAVAVICYTLGGRLAQSRWLKWVWLQMVITLALFPLSLFMFQQTSLVAPLANLLMVPYVSFLVVPLVLIGMTILPWSSTGAGVLFSAAESLFSFIWPLVQWLAALPYSHWLKAQPGMGLTLLALTGVAIMLAPRLHLWRVAGVLLLLPALTWQPRVPSAGAYELHVLDVGQGLAIVIRTHSHTLVYDTGARFSDRLDSGKAVLLPFLTNKGVSRIDLLMISHGDGDHIGGAASLLEAYPQTPVLGQGITSLDAGLSSHCASGQQWTWDGIVFTLLHPDNTDYPLTNNRSCVLKVTGEGGSVLITGDIEKKVENLLLSRHRHVLSADILVAPHHGSNTSSSPDFIYAVSPQIVIFAAGYRNRYHFPTADIVARYADLESTMVMTGHSGAISIGLHPERGVETILRYRESHRKYWHHMAPKLRQDG